MQSNPRKSWRNTNVRTKIGYHKVAMCKSKLRVMPAKHGKVSLFVGLADKSYRERIVDTHRCHLSREATLKVKCSACRTAITEIISVKFHEDYVTTIESCSSDQCHARGDYGRSYTYFRVVLRKKAQFWLLSMLQEDKVYGSGRYSKVSNSFRIEMGAKGVLVYKNSDMIAFQYDWDNVKKENYLGTKVDLGAKLEYPSASLDSVFFVKNELVYLTSTSHAVLPGNSSGICLYKKYEWRNYTGMIHISNGRFAAICSKSNTSAMTLIDGRGRELSRVNFQSTMIDSLHKLSSRFILAANRFHHVHVVRYSRRMLTLVHRDLKVSDGLIDAVVPLGNNPKRFAVVCTLTDKTNVLSFVRLRFS